MDAVESASGVDTVVLEGGSKPTTLSTKGATAPD